MKRSIYFTSDWHIGHHSCIKFDDRPFRNMNHMHSVLVNNYNSCVGVNDICYFVGDVGVGKKAEFDPADTISQLNGTKILVIGNHDKSPAYMATMFDAVVYGLVLYIAQHRVTVSHCPLRGTWREDTTDMKGTVEGEGWHGESRYKNQRLSFTNDGQFHLHGHIHSPNWGKSEKVLGKQRDIGVVANKYRPVHQSRIESWIAKFDRGR